MVVRVTTCMWGNAWRQYGENFVNRFAQFWPSEVELRIYADKSLPAKRGTVYLLDEIPGYHEFLTRWKESPLANGKASYRGSWKEKDIKKGYSWRHDAVKWMPQGITPWAASQDLSDGDILIWLDADVDTHKPVPKGWAESLLRDADVTFLGRPGRHSEIGFMGFRMPHGRKVAQAFAEMFLDDKFHQWMEWHSAYLFDRAVDACPDVKSLSLTPEGAGHVWMKSPLREYTIHYKGPRKTSIPGVKS